MKNAHGVEPTRYMKRKESDWAIECSSNCGPVFGYDNDYYWHAYVRSRLLYDLNQSPERFVKPGNIIWNAASLHVYERHFKFLEQ